MAGDPGRALDTLDVLVTKAHDITGDERLGTYAQLSEQTRARLGFLGETVVVALAGGTGVGKSSLLNAIAGTQVAETGAMRPTTDHPRAWIPAMPEPGLTRLLDSLDVDERIGHSGRLDVAIIDLPDFDSVETAHRAVVERLVPRVDAIVWVFDPQKYADRAIHQGYLRPLAGHQDRFLFVLNQIDLLEKEEVDLVRADLLTRLAEDGIDRADLFSTVAKPGHLAGIASLIRFLEERLHAKRLVLNKLANDLRTATDDVSSIVGVGGGVDFDHRWEEARDRAAGVLADARVGEPEITAAERAGRRLAIRSSPIGLFVRAEEPPKAEETGREAAAIQEASGTFDSLVTDLAFETGGHFGARLRTSFDPHEVATQMRRSLEGAKAFGSPMPTPARWWRPAAIAQWLLVVALAGAIVWGWARPDLLRSGSWPWPVIVGVFAILAWAGIIRLSRWSGTRSGRTAAEIHRASTVAALGEQIDRRLGVDVRTVMRDRAEVSGLLVELAIEAAKIETGR